MKIQYGVQYGRRHLHIANCSLKFDALCVYPLVFGQLTHLDWISSCHFCVYFRYDSTMSVSTVSDWLCLHLLFQSSYLSYLRRGDWGFQWQLGCNSIEGEKGINEASVNRKDNLVVAADAKVRIRFRQRYMLKAMLRRKVVVLYQHRQPLDKWRFWQWSRLHILWMYNWIRQGTDWQICGDDIGGLRIPFRWLGIYCEGSDWILFTRFTCCRRSLSSFL